MQMLLALLLVVSTAEGAARPGPGDPAPEFSLQASNGKTISLSQFKGKQTVVLAFYPKAFTGG